MRIENGSFQAWITMDETHHSLEQEQMAPIVWL